MAQKTVTPTCEIEYKLLEFARTASEMEYEAFCQVLSTIQNAGVASLIPFTNLANLIKFGYFEAINTRQWAADCANFLEAVA